MNSFSSCDAAFFSITQLFFFLITVGGGDKARVDRTRVLFWIVLDHGLSPRSVLDAGLFLLVYKLNETFGFNIYNVYHAKNPGFALVCPSLPFHLPVSLPYPFLPPFLVFILFIHVSPMLLSLI